MTLPLQSHPFNAGGPVDPIWLAWLRTLEQGSTANNADLAAQISAIATALGSPDGTVANIPPLGGSQTQVFAGSGVQVNGNAQSGYQISLNTVADSGAGTFLLLTRDSFGRISGSVAGTAADVPYDNTTSGLTADDVQAAIDEVAAAVGSSSTTAWTLLNSWDFSVSGAVASIEASLAGYNEVLVVAYGVTLAASGYRGVQFSGDGGSTWATSYEFVVSTGIISTTALSFIALHTSASASARSAKGQGSLVTNCVTPFDTAQNLTGNGFFIPALGSGIKPNRIKVGGFTGSGTTTTNMTGGKVFIYAR